ncbi:MAG: 50S ribosomal protein L11 methyltransferase [Methylomonas sp.]|nr:50S ribosomal protein L11 methyltransferase [Methylomonas sp.]PPD20906.1 MAG: 50S ribosomal protein L11 methyltransferase [Methylomonas sp.]PPD26340.1 MAG: 50S ribosomal protein L11 methyltransferase [Methylomonas sp.]PPD38061.1 MAG: 50S ribosomal protein L11 methyltransferase [Methylomonas sp.]PPD40303.1 MAG: 50S ribosomal protein L11 methyltransferase [Methylomonas sp.]
MAWHQLSVVTDESTAPALADFFSELGAVSVTYSDAEDEPVYEPALDQTQIWSNTRVTALFELDSDPDIIHTLTSSQFPGQPLQQWLVEVIQDQAWERAWMDHFQPMLFADRLWICPSGQEQQGEGTVCMTLDPGLAFGTGTHPTTALCLEWLASRDLTGKTLIDYGCGSGILAVAALLLGGGSAHGVDIDPQALEATQYNAEKNAVAERLRYDLPQRFHGFEADVVVANILAKPLMELAANIAALVKPGGDLVLSGVLAEQADAVAQAYQALGLSVEACLQQGDWCRIDIRKPA